MTRLLARLSAFALVVFTAGAIRAQLPADNSAWKGRCALLTSQEAKITGGAAPVSLVKATRGLAGTKFAALAFDRSKAGEHNVSCTLFYLAAIAERAGNGGKPDSDMAVKYATMGADEVKFAHRQKLTLSQRMKLDEIKMSVKRGSLDGTESAAVIEAGDTTPVSLTP